MAKRPDDLRHGQPRPGDQLRAGQGGPPGRHRRHRPLRLPQPDQQRPGVPVHLPRRAGCARPRHQRGDEGGRRPRPGRAGQGGRARQRAARLRAGKPASSAPSTSSPSRSTRACCCGSRRPWRRRRWRPASPASPSTWTSTASSCRLRQGKGMRVRQFIINKARQSPKRDRLRRGRGDQDHPRGSAGARGGHRPCRSCSAARTSSPRRLAGARPASRSHRRRPGHLRATAAYTRRRTSELRQRQGHDAGAGPLARARSATSSAR